MEKLRGKLWGLFPLSCPPITELSRQKYDWAYERMPLEQTTTIHYDWALLNNKDIRDKYVITLRNKFDALQEKTETHTPNDEYENFVNAHLEAVAKYIPTKLRTKIKSPMWDISRRLSKQNIVPRSILVNKNDLHQRNEETGFSQEATTWKNERLPSSTKI